MNYTLSKKEVNLIADQLDELIELDELVPGLGGKILEMGDGPLFKKGVTFFNERILPEIENETLRNSAAQSLMILADGQLAVQEVEELHRIAYEIADKLDGIEDLRLRIILKNQIRMIADLFVWKFG